MKRAGALRQFLCECVFVVGAIAASQPTQAAQVVFTFNCIIADATTCNPTSPLGSLTLRESVVDAKRVDLDLTIYNRDGIGGLKYLYLNYDQSLPAGPIFGLVPQDAPREALAPVSLISRSLNDFGPAGTTLDLRLPPDTWGVFTYSASIAYARFFSSPYNHVDLNVDMFNLKDANGLLYAAFETTSGFYAGSRDLPPELPPAGDAASPPQNFMTQQSGELAEPSSLALLPLALGALGVASKLRKRAVR